MGFSGETPFFYCENTHKNERSALCVEFFVGGSDRELETKFHQWINEKNVAHVFVRFMHCPLCGTVLTHNAKDYPKLKYTSLIKKLLLIKRLAVEKHKAKYEYTFITCPNHCKKTFKYDATSVPADSHFMTEFILKQIMEIFNTFKYCPFCGKNCKGIIDITQKGHNLTYKINH